MKKKENAFKASLKKIILEQIRGRRVIFQKAKGAGNKGKLRR
jgi:hypothetical protein